jgi:hypothetical protein
MNSTMSDPNTKSAKMTERSRRRLGLLMFLALMLMQAAIGWSQNRGSGLDSQGVVNAPGPPTPYGSGQGGGGIDSILMVRRMKLLDNERRKSLVSDSDKLLRLATELNDEIAHSNAGTLTPEQLRKVAEIEKLAHNVRDKMVMTVNPPSAGFFPPAGP